MIDPDVTADTRSLTDAKRGQAAQFLAARVNVAWRFAWQKRLRHCTIDKLDRKEKANGQPVPPTAVQGVRGVSCAGWMVKVLHCDRRTRAILSTARAILSARTASE